MIVLSALGRMLAMIGNVLGHDGQPVVSRAELRHLRAQVDQIGRERADVRVELDRLHVELGRGVANAEEGDGGGDDES